MCQSTDHEPAVETRRACWPAAPEKLFASVSCVPSSPNGALPQDDTFANDTRVMRLDNADTYDHRLATRGSADAKVREIWTISPRSHCAESVFLEKNSSCTYSVHTDTDVEQSHSASGE